jgi:hypothetical protein
MFRSSGVRAFLVVACLACAPAADAATQAEIDLAHRALHGEIDRGTLSDGEAALAAFLEQNPGADHARFALGLNRFLISGERLLQDIHRFGLSDQRRNQWLSMAMMMRPIPLTPNPDPEPISHDELRSVVARWMDDVGAAEDTLAQMGGGEVKLRVTIGTVRMDMDGDGRATPKEALWRPFAALGTRFRPDEQSADDYVIAFDRGDAEWLRGYCHLCLALGNMILAHDTEPLFDHTAHMFFWKTETPYPFLLRANVRGDFNDFMMASDLIAFVHLLSFDVIEPERMRAAHGHLKAAVSRSRAMWTHYDAETDNDREWLPNPDQDSVLGAARITEQQRDVWLDALDEADALLDGERLARFWRGDGTRGVNVRRVFLEPRRFDLVLWIQGSAAGPYLEDGPLTTDGLWRRMEAAFDRRVFRNMFWMN